MPMRPVSDSTNAPTESIEAAAVSSHASGEATTLMTTNPVKSEELKVSNAALSAMEKTVQQMGATECGATLEEVSRPAAVQAGEKSWQSPTLETWPVRQYDKADDDGIKAGAQPLRSVGDTSHLTKETKEDLMYNLASQQRTIRTGRPMEKEVGENDTYQNDGGSYTLKDGRVTELNFADGTRITDIKQNWRGEVISATMPDGSKLVQNFRQNQGLVDGTHPDGYKLIARDGTEKRAPFGNAFANKTGFTTVSHHGDELNTKTLSGTQAFMDATASGSHIRTKITSASGQKYFNFADRSEKN